MDKMESGENIAVTGFSDPVLWPLCFKMYFHLHVEEKRYVQQSIFICAVIVMIFQAYKKKTIKKAKASQSKNFNKSHYGIMEINCLLFDRYAI